MHQDQRICLSTTTILHGDVMVNSSEALVGYIREIVDVYYFDEHGTLAKSITSIGSVPCDCCNLPKRTCQKSTSQIDFAAIRAWVRNCESTHQKCQDQADLPFDQKKIGCPSILIHVGRRCLVPVKLPPRYCALSYVYGGRQIFKANKRDFEKLQVPGSLDADWVHLPVVIRDAITLMENIGEEYLWTDALCIIHDDKDKFNDQIKRMDIIYSQAMLTLAVVSGEHAEQPIPGVLPHSRSPLPLTNLWDRDVCFCPVPVHLELQDSSYEQRAWTLQERLLSSRILFINDSGASFHCRESSLSELNWATHSNEHAFQRAFDQEGTSRMNPLDFHSLLEKGRLIKHEGVDEYTPQSIWTIYFDLVRVYSQRKLTYESDILFAFSGIQEVLAERFYHTSFFAGIPILATVIALHWIPGIKVIGLTNSTLTSIKRREFPSFSWIGWMTPVQWLEAICLPEWWQFQTAANIDLGLPSSLLHVTTHMALCFGLFAEISKEVVYPQLILNPGVECPLPLIKILDHHGRWCGRLCDVTTAAIDSPHNADLRLLLLSTCAARKINIVNPEETHSESEFRFSFDTDVFPTHRPDGMVAKLVNLLLVKPGDVTADLFSRAGLCQIHQDVWESLEKDKRTVMLA